MALDLLSIYGQMMGFVKQFYWTMQQFWSWMFTPLDILESIPTGLIPVGFRTFLEWTGISDLLYVSPAEMIAGNALTFILLYTLVKWVIPTS